MNKIKIILVILISHLMISCGFHLRGAEDLSAVLPEVKIKGISIHSDLGRELIRGLTAAKINVLDESDITLEISQHKLSKRVLSLDSAGRANQYELNYLISFNLLKKSSDNISELKKSISNNNLSNIKQLNITKDINTTLIPQQTMSVRREFFYDANLVLAKADEEKRLATDMRQSMVQQIIRRISFSLKSRNNNKSSTKTEDQSVKPAIQAK